MYKVIPPVQMCVKAGFIVFKPDESPKQLIIVEEGKLIAYEWKNGEKSFVFEMNPGDLIGVAALLEKEEIHYHIEAAIDSKITIIDEECMESQLIKAPVWLVALMKSLSLRTRELKKSRKQTRAPNLLQSMTLFLYYKNAKELPLFETIQEYCFQTRSTIKSAYANLKYLHSNNMICLKGDNEETIFIDEPMLLSILTDCFSSKQSQSPYYPFHLSPLEKECLLFLSKYNSSELESGAWLNILQSQNPLFSASEWIRFQEHRIFVKVSEDKFLIHQEKIREVLLALENEKNIKKIILCN